MHRAKPEGLVEYATTYLENRQVQVQPVEFWATIDEVSDSGSRTPNLDVIRNGAGYSCFIGGTQVSEVLGRHRTRNDGEASFIQLLTGTRRQLEAIQDGAQAVLHLHVLLAVECGPFDARHRSVREPSGAMRKSETVTLRHRWLPSWIHPELEPWLFAHRPLERRLYWTATVTTAGLSAQPPPAIEYAMAISMALPLCPFSAGTRKLI